MLTQRMRAMGVAVVATTLALLALAGSASAKLTGEYERFQQCPWTTEGVIRCLYAVTDGGEVTLGSKTVPIVNDAVLQGGFKEQNEETEMAEFVAAKNGVTLSKSPQPVPGGLAGLVKCNEITDFILKAACQFTFENGLTGVNSTLELARPANEILISDSHLGEEFGTALKLPIKIRLENPLLGSNCYVGSEASPIYWNLTSGTTSPPEPNKPISGTTGTITLLEGGRILRLDDAVLVDNAWAAPGAKGCGGIFSFILDPIINLSAGLPAKAGVNTAILESTTWVGNAFAVKKNDTENP